MRNPLIKFFTLVSIAFISIKANAQQDPMYTQYMYNMRIINPAYALDDPGIFRIGGIYRNQWTGIEGAPETANFFAQGTLTDRVEAGISIVHDEIGDIVKENNLYADVAYVLPVSENSKLSFGVKAGVTFFDADLSRLRTNEPDPTMQNISEAFPNFGVGAYWFSDNYYVGLSAPNLFTAKHLENETGLARLGEESTHYFLTGGYVFDINPNFKLKPAFMLRGVEGAPLSADVTANVLLYDRFEAGVAYRFDNTVSGLVNFKVTPQLRVGYAYDYTTGNLSDFNDGTHEIMVIFDIDFLGLSNGYDVSPRFF